MNNASEILYVYTGGQDFTPVAVPNLVFQDGQELCTNIMLIDDSIHEDQETFTIAITTTDSAANLGTSAALVTISDNDGKHFYTCGNYKYYTHIFLHRCFSQVCSWYTPCQ